MIGSNASPQALHASTYAELKELYTETYLKRCLECYQVLGSQHNVGLIKVIRNLSRKFGTVVGLLLCYWPCRSHTNSASSPDQAGAALAPRQQAHR